MRYNTNAFFYFIIVFCMCNSSQRDFYYCHKSYLSLDTNGSPGFWFNPEILL